MNFMQLIRIIIIGSTIPPPFYLVFIGLRSIKDSPKNRAAYYFTLSMFIMAISFATYLIKPFLSSNQLILAEFSMGVGLVLMQFGMVFYIEYLHTIYKLIPIFSKLFYYMSAIGFISLLFNPWTIEYSQSLQVFTQSLSDLYFISITVQICCTLLIITNVLNQIKKRINLSKRSKDIVAANKKINFVHFSFFIAAILIIIGLSLPGTELDTLGIIILLVPQALILFRDKEFFIYLLVQRVEESTEDLQKNFIQLMEQKGNKMISPLALETATQTLVTFIEKADDFLQKKANQE